MIKIYYRTWGTYAWQSIACYSIEEARRTRNSLRNQGYEVH